MKTTLSIVVSVLILAAGVVGLRIFGQKPEIPTREASTGDEAVPVVTAAVTAFNQPFDLAIDGEASTYRVVTIGTEVEGRIVRKAEVARSGTHISAGTVLFEIDPTTYQLEIDRLKAQLLEATEQLQAVAVDLENAELLADIVAEDWQLQKNQVNRMKELLLRRTANETEVENAMKQELAVRNNLQTLKNQQKSLRQQQKTKLASKALVEAQLQRAEVDLQRCIVTSPLEGRVVDDAVEEGDYVKTGDVLVHVSDSSRMEIKCQLQGEELAWVWQQTGHREADPERADSSADPLNIPPVPCEVAFRFEGVETIWDGYISRLEGTGIDRDTRTFPCRVLVEEPRKTRVNNSAGGRPAVALPTLLSGMYVTVRIPIESPIPLLQMPLEAVRPGGQVWVSRDGVLQVIAVSPAHIDGAHVLVRQMDAGLTDGDRVIISPLASVQDGMSVRDTSEEASE